MRRRVLLIAAVVLAWGLMQKSWSEERNKTVLIVALGDSVTAGAPFYLSPAESPPEGQGDPEGQYAYWMMKDHPDWKVVNLGIRTQRTDEIRARFDDVFKEGPKYVIVQGGSNDIVQGTSIREACKNLEWMYRQAKLRSVMPVAVTIPPMNELTPAQNDQLARVNAWIKEAAERHNILFADLHAAVADAQDAHRLNGTTDGYHPDIGGYRAIGKAIAKAIEPLERSRPTDE